MTTINMDKDSKCLQCLDAHLVSVHTGNTCDYECLSKSRPHSEKFTKGMQGESCPYFRDEGGRFETVTNFDYVKKNVALAKDAEQLVDFLREFLLCSFCTQHDSYDTLQSKVQWLKQNRRC